MESRTAPRARHPDLNKLRLFAAVAEEEHVSRAAERLGLSQSTLSMQVRDLERSYGVALFDRIGRGVRLTEAGHVVYRYARKILALTVELDEVLHDLDGMRWGELRLGASTTVGEYVLPLVLGRFRQQYPEIRVTVAIGNTGQMAERLRRGDLHLGLIGEPLDDPELELEPWLEDELVLAVPPGHRWAGRKISIQDLGTENWIAREAGSATREVTERALLERGIQMTIVMELGGTEAVKGVVAAGLGVAFVSACAVEREFTVGHLARATVDGLAIHRRFQLARARGRSLTAAERAFVPLLRV